MFVHFVKIQVDLDLTFNELGDGEDTQGAFHLSECNPCACPIKNLLFLLCFSCL
jgi:hypothetical protein